MKLVVGLGNPGKEYAGTRHNIGWEVVDHLAARVGFVGSPSDFDRLARTKFEGLAVDGTAPLAGGGEKLLLLKPTTYMNLSGRSVQAAMAFYQLGPADVMVVLDDLALPAGKIRLRPGGSDGGHNGLKDIKLPAGAKALQDPDLIVAMVKVIEEEAVAPAPEAETAEPEVIGRKPEEGEAAEAEAKPEKK